jgi:hypothetical protein
VSPSSPSSVRWCSAPDGISFPLSFLVMVVGLEGTGVSLSPNSLVWAMDLQCLVPPAASHGICVLPTLRNRSASLLPVPFRGKACAASIYFQSVLDEAAGSRESYGSTCTRVFHSLFVDLQSNLKL